MYKTILAAASLALCAAMPFTASAQSSLEDSDFVAMWCQLNVSFRPQRVFADRGTERKSSECFAAALEMLMLEEGRINSGSLDWDEDPDVVNAYICRNRERSGGYGRQCEQFMANR